MRPATEDGCFVGQEYERLGAVGILNVEKPLDAEGGRSCVLYNLDRVKEADELVLVEGYWSVFRLYRLGIPAVALMGRDLSPHQEDLLAASGTERLVLLLDGDGPGREAAAAILPRLARRFVVRLAELPEGRQPDTVAEEVLGRLLVVPS